ncbi:nucleotidyl transferase AbiEii/AbiGii toxin family protein [Nonomuraea sediminis]|uniref:nucleotidyl transferase AbiEii/AbiGii toxin family protein n=1 Tax=Nonomuraea sediminis TaxID=2835864 RepID=UPI0027E158DB|nr:nucleotidyl transferase AbiEii/AbiGii toxin family protein [Nonomuraea sediminis]
MRLPAFHLLLLETARPVCERFGLLLAGGYAMRAHGFTERPSQDLDFATASETPLPEIAAQVAAEFRAQGFTVEVLEVTQRMGRLIVTDEVTEQACEFDLLREASLGRPLKLELCEVVGQDDAVGLKVRALHQRGVPRDFIDVAAVSDLYSFRELERLGALHDDEFLLEDLIQRLESVDLLADEAFLAYGIGEERLHEIRRLAYAWVEDIKLRRADDGDADWDDPDVPEVD